MINEEFNHLPFTIYHLLVIRTQKFGSVHLAFAFLAFSIFFIAFTFLLFHPFTSVQAQERMISENYRIIFGNLNSGAGIPSSDNYILDSTIGQTGPGLYSSTNYRVKAGFQYIHSIIPFSFVISDISIDLGELQPDTFSTATNTLTVSAGGAGAYQVKAAENHPLETASGANQIPDTTCDTSCDETTAAVWTSTSSYGFGFNMTGDDIATDFVNSTYFRQFADESSAESPQTIMTSVNVGRDREATVTYKANISSSQAGGTYQNFVKFTAIPGF